MLDIEINKKLGNTKYCYKLKTDARIVAVMGQSGSGKTTFLKLLSGLIKPDSGRIVVNDKVLFHDNEINVRTRDREIAYIFQHDNLFPHLNVERNINIGLDDKNSENISTWLERFGLKDIRKSKVTNLSGGERQRIALIRALLHNPRLLMLDEAFSSLDEESKNLLYLEVKNVLDNYSGHTILVTHDYKEAIKLADEIYYLADCQLKRVWNNFLEGEIESIEEKNSGDIFSIKSGSMTLKGILLKDFTETGKSCKVEIEASNVLIQDKENNAVFHKDCNIINARVIEKKDDIYILETADNVIYSRSIDTYKTGDDIIAFIRYKNVNIIK